jgi:arsenite methyltransferase
MTRTSEELKKIVQEKYSIIAEQSIANSRGCGCGCSDAQPTGSLLSGDYSRLEGYTPEADLNLGCGIPTQHARISKGDTVVDLGSGAGNDCFVAASLCGESGKVIGIDMSGSMIMKARINALKTGRRNVEFRLGEIENMPVEDNTADTVLSNCVMNLVPDKPGAFAETYRILKPGGHFSISDIVIRGDMPDSLRKDAEMYAGCVAGALKIEEYLGIIHNAGFISVQVLEDRKKPLPGELISGFGDQQDIHDFQSGEKGLYSITVYGEKPGKAKT